MLGKSGWLAGVLAACLISLFAGAASADGGRYGHGAWGHGKHYQKHQGYKKHGHKKHGYKQYGHHKEYGHKHRRRHYGDKHYGRKHYGRKHYRPYYPSRRKYVYDDGYCRVVVKSGPHGYKKRVRCDGYYPGARFIPQALIHTDPPAYPGQVLTGYPQAVSQTLEQAPDGQGIVWNEPQSQDLPSEARYEVTPTKTYQAPDGRYCREYLTSATVAGQVQEVYGQACRQPDGTWELVQ